MKRKVNRRIWAGAIAILLLFLQLFPFAVMAEGLSYEPPKYDVPQYDNPGIEAPQWEVPTMEPSTWEVPSMQPPQYEVEKPDIPVQDPNIQAPQIDPPKAEPAKPDPVSGDPQSDKPFTQTLGYEALKFSVKDVMGGTFGYTAELIDAGEVDMPQVLKSRGWFLTGLGIKGLDMFLKDVDGWGTVTGLGVDGLDLKGGYDSLKFVFQQAPNSKLAPFINSVTSFSNMEPPKFPALFKGLNVGIAGVSLVFDGIDTFNNFSMVFDSSLSEEQQNEKFVEGVGNVGSVLMDAGVIASVIPALQPIAGGLFVAGAALWLLSRAVKWTDKLAGGAITRSIRNGFGKAYGWVKSLFA